MPRIIKASARKVQEARGGWYAYHFENRQMAKVLPEDTLKRYLSVASMITPPKMTIFGGVPEDYPERAAYEAAERYGLNIHLINPWYLSEEGWRTFQELFTALPEPVDLYTEQCVQVGELYTLYTMPEEANVK